MRGATYIPRMLQGMGRSARQFDLEQRLRALGCEEVTHYAEGEAGPEGIQLVCDLEAQMIDALAVASLADLAEVVPDVPAFLRRAPQLGVWVVSRAESWTRVGPETWSHVLAALSWSEEFDRARHREATRAGLEAARERGTRSGRRPGRPRVSPLLLGAAARHRRRGKTLREAASAAGVSVSSLKRFLQRRRKQELEE